MAKHFTTKRISDSFKVLPGVGTKVIPVQFVPDFIRVEFQDIKHKPDPDTVTWDLAVAAYGYDLTINYTCHEERVVHYVVAKLAVDPEQTIAF
jgi:hypothetical protein